MNVPKIYEKEYEFCLLLWANEPMKSGELVKLCRERLNWMPTTTYTVIKRLSERGVLENRNTVVRALITKKQAQLAALDDLTARIFEGSFPALISCLTSRPPQLTLQEVNQVAGMIDRYRSDLEFRRVTQVVGSYWDSQKDD